MSLPSSPRHRGAVLVALGLLLLVLSFGASWALAEDRTSVDPAVDANDTATLVGVQGPARGGNVTLLDGRGEVVWTHSGAISYQGVDRLEDGTVLATFADDAAACGPYEPPCKRTGVRLVDPEPRPVVVDEWSYPVRTRKDSEVHDAEVLPNGELLVADMEHESVFTVNRSTGERTWTWNASSFYDPPPDPTREDWLHINDVDRIGPGRYLVSVRNTNQLLVVERGTGVIEVINEDRDPAVMNRQHNPHWLGDGQVLVADSENDRVVELHRNDSTGEWAVAWTVHGAGGIRFDWPRDADRLPNGNTLVTDSRNNRVVEVRSNGTLVASYATQPLPYEADRLPYAESFGSPYGGGDAADGEVRGRDVPVLTPALAGLRHVVALPHWVAEWHLLAVLASLGLWLWGGGMLARTSR